MCVPVRTPGLHYPAYYPFVTPLDSTLFPLPIPSFPCLTLGPTASTQVLLWVLMVLVEDATNSWGLVRTAPING